MIEVSDTGIAEFGGFAHFMDWSAVTGYDSVVRKRCTDWALAQTRPYPRYCILSSNKLVGMGVSAAAMALAITGRSLESFTDPHRFAVAVRQAEAQVKLGRGWKVHHRKAG